MNTKWILSLGIAAGLLIVGGFAILFQRPYLFQGSEIQPEHPLENFTLTDQLGNRFNLSDHQGKVLILTFGYTHCPDVCPVILTKYQEIKKKLGSRAANVEFVFITVDPERDSPEVLRDYLSFFDTKFIGLSGSRAELEPVWQSYGVYQERTDVNSTAGYMVDHTARLYGVDQHGNLRVTYAFESGADAVVQDVAQMLSEK